MARNLFWKAKVAHSLTLTILLLFAFQQTQAQSAHTPAGAKKITLTGSPVPFREVIDRLTKITGLHFIYSADRIDSEKLVSIFAREKTLDDILAILGREMKVTFKRQDKYIVIKAAPLAKAVYASVSKPELKQWEVHQKIQDPENTFAFAENSIDRPALYPSGEVTTPAFKNSYLKEYAKQLHVYFDTSLLKTIAVSDLRKLNTRIRHRGLFVSGGLVLNDFSAGVELRAGYRSLYMVYNPGLLKGGQFHSAYGLGTSFLLSRNFSLNEIYTYSVIKQNHDMTFNSPRGKVHDIRNELSARHHQVKILLQYAATPHISLSFGSSFNYMNTTYSIAPPTMAVYHVAGVVGSVGPDGNFATPGEINQYPFVTNQRFHATGAFKSHRESNRLWIGWEAGISYRINIFQKR